MAKRIESRLEKLEEKLLEPSQNGTFVDFLWAIKLHKFEYSLSPERKPPISDDPPKIDLSKTDWRWFWVDKEKVLECEAAMKKYQQSGADTRALEELQDEYRDFRATDYSGYTIPMR